MALSEPQQSRLDTAREALLQAQADREAARAALYDAGESGDQPPMVELFEGTSDGHDLAMPESFLTALDDIAEVGE